MKFQKKAIIVDAEQYLGPPSFSVDEPHPSATPGVIFLRKFDETTWRPFVMTANGQEVFVTTGDWVIKEMTGSGYYPCKDEIFRVTYTPVGEGVDVVKLEAACRKMLAQEFDDICWLDVYREIGVLLGIPYDPKLLPKEKFLGNCSRYFDCMAAGKTEEYKTQ